MNNEVQEKKAIMTEAFTQVAPANGRIPYFPRLGQQLVDHVQIPPGARALDVATGRGAILFPAVARVGPKGSVMGIDIAPGKVQETRAEIARRGMKNAHVLLMDAEALDFPKASFDYVLCGFALQLFQNLDLALAEFRRVLRPGGWIAVSTWGADDERWDWYRELLVSYQADVKLRRKSFEQPTMLEQIFASAGFSDARVHPQTFDWVRASPDEWWDTQWSISGRVGLEKLEPGVLEMFKADVFEHLQVLKQPDGLHELLRYHITVAQKPAFSSSSTPQFAFQPH